MLPTHHNKDTLTALGYGAVLLVWLSTENASVWVVSLLGTGLALMLLRLAVLRWLGGKTISHWFPAVVLFGASIGFLAVWCAVGLMVFKNAWHAHAYLDFPTHLIQEMPRRVLAWTVAGACLGGAARLFKFVVTP